MTNVLFDTLALARKLEEAGFPSHQAQATSAAFAEILSGEVATGRDVGETRTTLQHEMRTHRLELEATIESVRQELDAKIESVRQELHARIDRLEQRLTIRLGGMMAASIGIVAALVQLL